MSRQLTTLLLVGLFALIPAGVVADHHSDAPFTFHPIEHGTLAIEAGDAMILVDPVGSPERFQRFGTPDIILITHIHPDHLAVKLVHELAGENTVVIAGAAVQERLELGETLANGASRTVGDVKIDAVAMYNLTEERLKFHPKGRGNGYVVNYQGKRVYVSGDTEDIPEMRALKNIDYAFVCMNLPYTMTVEQAASAVLEFAPKVVYPYHYRGSGGFSDVEQFKKLVAKNPNIEVRLAAWYE